MTTATRNEAAERLREALRLLTSQNVYDTAWLDALDEALREEGLRVGRSVAALHLTDDHEVCDQQQREAVAAERRATLHALGKRFDNELGVTVEVAKVLRIIAEERDR